LLYFFIIATTTNDNTSVVAFQKIYKLLIQSSDIAFA